MEHEFHVPLYSLAPFALMLGAIAVLPLTAHHFWESNKNKLIVALALGIPTMVWLLVVGMSHELSHIIFFDYVPFIVLLGALFIITGGIFVDGNIEAKPRTNTIFLAIGAVLASLMGTTGAAMLLIRPVIKTNSERKFKVHTILFFIAIVANCGGLLTPLGDPPLFMMYLRGADFFWFAKLYKEWAFVNVALLIIYFIVDTFYWNKESEADKKIDKEHIRPITVKGKLNFLWLLGVVLAVAFINENTLVFIKQNHNLKFLREAVLILMAFLSLRLTPEITRAKNNFSWEPIVEVAYLFIGIFITMVPALEYLKQNASAFGLSSPASFYYATGFLSGFLDNTPTAVTFYNLELGLTAQHPEMLEQAANIIAGIPEKTMEAICVASVFFGAFTYIGNGPNFMVKAIAESQNIKMPDFFSYIFKFSLIVLIPLFIIAQLIFVPW